MHPDGSKLASGGKDGTVRVWDLSAPNAPPVPLGRHDATVRRVLFSPDGRLLGSGGHDHSIRLWNMENPEALPVILPGHDGNVKSLAFSADSKYLVTGGEDNAVKIWDLAYPLNSAPPQDIADMICQKVRRNLTLYEWQKFVGDEIPYERTCPNLPIHPSLFEAAANLAQGNDLAGTVALLERAVELEPTPDEREP
jgi:WD40 repeat protein